MQPLFLRKTMLRISLTVFFLFVSFLYSFTGLGEGASAVPEVKSMAKPDRCAELFREMQLEGEVNYTAFRQAVTGYYRIAQRKKEILTLIDFSKPSTEKRLYVFDMKEKKMLFSSVVAHGIAEEYMQRLSPMNMARTKVHWDSILRLLLIRERTVIR